MFWDKWKYELFDRNTIIDTVIENYKDKVEKMENNKINALGSLSYLFFLICLVISFFNIIVKMTNQLGNETLKNSIYLVSYLVCILIVYYTTIKISFSQFRNSNEIKMFSFKYIEIFKKGFYIFWKTLFLKEFWEKLSFIIIYFSSITLFSYPILNFSLNKKFNFYETLLMAPLIIVLIFEKYKSLQPTNKIKEIYNKIVSNYNKCKIIISIVIFLVILNYFFCENLSKIEIIKFLKSDKVYFLHWTIGVCMLEFLNKKYSNDTRHLILSGYSMITGLLFFSGIYTLYTFYFKKSESIIHPLNTIIIFILILLIVNKLIINLEEYKTAKKKIYNDKIERLKEALEMNQIDKNKYEEVLKRSIDKSEEYYNLENKFNLVAKSLLLWGGISIIIEKIKNLKLEIVKNFIKEINKDGIEFVTKVITEYEYLIVLLTYIIFFIIVLWVIWIVLFFVFEKIVEIKYISKRELFEFRDLLQDIIIMEDKDGK